MLNILEEEGFDSSLCLAGTGLTHSLVLENDTKISDETEIQIIETALSMLPKKAGYGVRAGRALRVTTFGIWGLAILASPNLRTAFMTMNRFSALSYTLSQVHLVEQDDNALFVVNMDQLPETLHRFMFERYFSTTMIFMREMLSDFDVSQFSLEIPDLNTNYAGELSRMTGRPVQTGCANFAVTTSRALLDQPLPKADPLTHAHFVGQCQALLNQRQELPDFSQFVRDYILQNSAYSPRLQDVADAAGLSTRSLRRRLENEETSFSEIVLETKMTLAKELLLTADMPVQIVSTQLGYSEPASFTRAFTQWWGQPPSKIAMALST